MHDDRIAGVTFEENALRNALIVNEEYAWVGNPFSAPTTKGEPVRFSLLLLMQGMPGACPRDLKAPLSGAGGVNNGSRPSLAHSASVSPVFRSRVAKERRIARFSFLFFGGGTGFDARDLKAPLSGAGGVHNESRPSLALCASPVFRSRKKGKNLATLPFLFCLHGTGACAVSGFRMPIQARCSRLYCRPAGDLS